MKLKLLAATIGLVLLASGPSEAQDSLKAQSWIPESMSDKPVMTNDNPPTSQDLCNLKFLWANAIFIRAIAYCQRDYMDSSAGNYALAMSRNCAAIGEHKLMSLTKSAMTALDAVVRQHGKASACRWVDGIEREIEPVPCCNN